MTYEEAKKILHPDTTLETLAKIEYYAGFNGEEAKRKAVDEACLVACEALDRCIEISSKKTKLPTGSVISTRKDIFSLS